jgi:threonine/homoserine/homoserine lactone efflux protein
LRYKPFPLTYTYAVFTGFVLAFGFGPVFFSILQTSIEKGQKAGFLVTAGTFSSDLVLASVAYLGMFSLEINGKWGFWLKIVGGIVLIALGVSQLFASRKNVGSQISGKLSALQLFLKGVVLNVFNPLNFLTWTAIVLAIKSHKLSITGEIAHLAVILLTILVMELILAHFAYRMRYLFQSQNLRRMKIFVSLVMFLAALKLFTSL